jgi:hypothetical protein
VKAIFIAFLLTFPGCSYHIGRMPSVESVVSVGEIQAVSADAELRPVLARALGVGLARRAKVGNGPSVDLEIIEARVSPVGGHYFRLSLKLKLSMEGKPAADARGSQVFKGSPDATQHRNSRIAATKQLASQLIEIALMDLLSPKLRE